MNNKLDEFYRTRAGFPDWMTEEEWNQKEIEIIRERIEPQVVQQMTSLLQGVKCPLTIKVERSEEGRISVCINRTGDENDNTKIDEDENQRIHRSESVGFMVCFPDGTIIKRRKAKDTFVEVLKFIGLSRVASFRSRTFVGIPLVSKTRRLGYGEKCKKCQEEIDGWYVYIHMSNKEKIEVLRMISAELKLGLIVKTEDGETEGAATTYKKGRRQMFLLNGYGPFNKRNCVWETVNEYMKRNPSTTSQQLQQRFPADVQGSYGVVRTIQWVQRQQQAGKDFIDRYFVSPDKVINTSDGEQIVVCNQWGDNFCRFVDTAKELNLDIVEADI